MEKVKVVLELTPSQSSALWWLAKVWLDHDGPAYECMTQEWGDPRFTPEELTQLRVEVMSKAGQ